MASTSTHNQSVKITKTVIDHVAVPTRGQAFVRDAELKGFALRVTANGVKSFVVEKRIDGRVRRITLAKYPELTVEQARRQAYKVLGQVASGINPLAERQRERVGGRTLEQVFAEFKKTRTQLKPRTLYDYERLLETAFADWMRRPLAAITKDMVTRRHGELGQASGEAYANLAMRVLRSIFNFALAHFEDGFGQPIFTENPVMKLTRTRAWFRSERRQTLVKVHQFPAWFDAVDALRQDPTPFAHTVADYLLFLLFSGLRRQEAAQLTWDRVDQKDRTLTIPDPKNRLRHVLPLSEPLEQILERRKSRSTGAFVFPGEGRAGYLIEPKKQVAKVIQASGIEFSLHDLRRTFITIAERIDVAPYSIKRLVNHKTRNDVTAGYIVSDTERLRAPLERINDFMLKAAKRKPSADVIPLSEDARGVA